jgi:hypothetical protein
LNRIAITQWYKNWKMVDGAYYVSLIQRGCGLYPYAMQIPRKAINLAHFKESDKIGHHKKYGIKHFYHIVVDGKRLENAAWYFGDKVDEKVDDKAEGKASGWFIWPFGRKRGKAGELKDWIGLRK